MKICVTTTSNSLDSEIDPRFGRCPYFLIVDPETMSFEAIPNPNINAMGGAGIQSAQLVVNKGVKAVITGRVGPNAYQVLSAAGIEILTATGKARQAIEAYKRGELKAGATPAMGPPTGMGPGMGMGRGMGMGMGMGIGRGMGRGMGRRMGGGMTTPTGSYPGFTPQPPQTPPQPGSQWPWAAPPTMTREEEIRFLEEQMRELQKRLDQIHKRIKELREE
ncbi:MAG: dinitrogenase iron-molybdenum cofactor biosynthesis protein [Methanobacteriota archaeon]|nr:MAG: dinitrogenase iron-molybdenum cofactor biosynthesis protein [Euryarchaeota archaeon]